MAPVLKLYFEKFPELGFSELEIYDFRADFGLFDTSNIL
jgi:hypothetical protein